jgi:hypothetical protein
MKLLSAWRKSAIILWLSVTLATAGCGLSEISAQNRATDQQNREVYEIYRSYMASSNAERERAGLPPQPIRSFEEWQQAPGTN